jgi:hypothetical protein
MRRLDTIPSEELYKLEDSLGSGSGSGNSNSFLEVVFFLGFLYILGEERTGFGKK